MDSAPKARLDDEERGCTREELAKLREEVKKTLSNVKRECSRGITGRKNLEKLRSGIRRATMRRPKLKEA